MKIWDSMVIVCGMKRQCVVWFSGCGMKGQCVEEAADNHQRFPGLPPFLPSHLLPLSYNNNSKKTKVFTLSV